MSEEALNDSKDLAERLRFWRDLDTSTEVVDPLSNRSVISSVTGLGSDGAGIARVAGNLKAFMDGIVKFGGPDMLYYHKSGKAGQICRATIEWTDSFGNFGYSDELFIAPDEGSAVLAGFRYVIAQQVAVPDAHCILRRVRISQISLDVINEHGQKFYGATDNFFEWNLNGFCTVADEGAPVTYDFATLVAASVYADVEAWVPPSYSAFRNAVKEGAVA
ncbi:hypothetical protein G6L37_07595 [Agrobacterium rubi]|nr:hypothetical protein [Agrobacterium rubi]NTF25232.1 hypothetical protein [Agrobacterium rubi]